MVTHTKMGILQRWLKRQALASVTQPLSRPVISNEASYSENVGYAKLGWRHFRRALVFAFSGQGRHLHTRIEPGWKKGLWLYKGIPQIGDSLMDLAPRSLLYQEGLRIDLYTDTHLAALYRDDPWFQKVFHDPRDIQSGDYDFVIVPSHKNRSLKDKSRLLPQLPWVSMHGFYTGPDFHRARFATQRLLDFLGHTVGPDEFDRHEAQKLRPLEGAAHARRSPLKMALAMGGVNAPRTYRHWPQLAKTLAEQLGPVEVTLLGSANGTVWAEAFEADCAGMFPVNNQVNRTSLTECRALIHEQDLFIAADGGLMHLGTTTCTPLVSLFNGEISPLWQLSQPHLQFALQSETVDVNDVPMPAIVHQVHQALAAGSAHADAKAVPA
jgi:ADP-heptose:LPS heptosyltransferase